MSYYQSIVGEILMVMRVVPAILSGNLQSQKSFNDSSRKLFTYFRCVDNCILVIKPMADNISTVLAGLKILATNSTKSLHSQKGEKAIQKLIFLNLSLWVHASLIFCVKKWEVLIKNICQIVSSDIYFKSTCVIVSVGSWSSYFFYEHQFYLKEWWTDNNMGHSDLVVENFLEEKENKLITSRKITDGVCCQW